MEISLFVIRYSSSEMLVLRLPFLFVYLDKNHESPTLMELKTQLPKQAVNQTYQRKKVAVSTFQAFIDALDNYFYYTNRARSLEETTESYLTEFFQFFFPNTSPFSTQFSANILIKTIAENENYPAEILIFETDYRHPKLMISTKNLNKKSFYDIVIAYLIEVIKNENDALKTIIVTDAENFYLINCQYFKQYFTDEVFINEFKNWQTKSKNEAVTKAFYKTIKAKIECLNEDLPAIYFNLNSYQNHLELLKNDHGVLGTGELIQEKTKRELVEIYKILSPDFLKNNLQNEAKNTLNKTFYYELLHIIGLEEKGRGNNKILVRCESPNIGSLIENTIIKLRTEDVLYHLQNKKTYGNTESEQYFKVALELVITWLNRIFFLKVLETKLMNYNADDSDKGAFRFLHPDKVDEFDTINTLFFEVLALPEKDRDKNISKRFGRIPYLNSSLFEVTYLERQTLRISNIKDSTKLPIASSTALQRSGEGDTTLESDGTRVLPTLTYLLKFLDAYDFGIEASETILKDETKTFISTAQLGLVFEKLIGHEIPSNVTDTAIIDFMSQNTLRKAVIDKLKNGFNWSIETFEDLIDNCKKLYQSEDLAKANTLINSITICDPAVGSGRLLVACLHQLLLIKSELGILCDTEGKSLSEKITLKIEGDELLIYLSQNLGGNKFDLPFEYKVSFETGLRKLNPQLQRVQEAIFYEKKQLIEHSLFGVDTNRNAVRICRLRLWLELLKSSFYRQRRNTQLETLPNIDINIKKGNSLIARFALDTDLNAVFKKTEYSVEEYKRTVKAYKAEEEKSKKRLLSQYLDDIKSEFEVTFNKREKEKIAKTRGKKDSLELQIRYNRNLGYEPTEQELEELEKLNAALERKETKREEILDSDIHEDAFEWRFEFPEVLDENGDYEGFDVVISHPPHLRIQNLDKSFRLIKPDYATFMASGNLYELFYELALKISKDEGLTTLFTLNKWQKIQSGEKLRQFMETNSTQLLFEKVEEKMGIFQFRK